MFVEISLDLLKKNGKFGYIIPNNWLTISNLKLFRDHILSNTGNLHIVNYGYQVFDAAAVDTSTLIFEKTEPSIIKIFKSPKQGVINKTIEYDQCELMDKETIPLDADVIEAECILRAMNQFKRLGNYAKVKCGLTAYGNDKGKPPQTQKMKKNRIYHADNEKDKSYRRYLKGKDVKRYELDWSGQWLKYGKNLASPVNARLFEGERILVRQIPTQPPHSIHATITDDDYLNDRNSMIIHATDSHKTKEILGLLNSKIITFWFNATYQKLQRGTFPQFKIGELANFPMALDTPFADKIAKKVDEIMQLIPNIGDPPNPTMQAKEDRLNDELDALAYQAYGIAPEDIDFIEKSILPVEPPKSP